MFHMEHLIKQSFKSSELRELREYVAAGGCCEHCASGEARLGTADCDVNPLRRPLSLDDARARIAELEVELGASTIFRTDGWRL
jgi:hypothetical protein